MSLRKQLQRSYDLGESAALEGRESDPWEDIPGLVGEAKFNVAAYEAGYDKGRVEFIRLAKALQAAARLKS